jgi:NAD(P)H-binding/Transposase, Mutator family
MHLAQAANVAEHLPDKQQAWVDAKLVKAFAHADPDTGLANAKSLAAQLGKNYPSAASSLREGLDEMFTVARLGIDGRLANTLTTSNPVESMISIAPTTNRNVTRCRDGQMVLRWTAAGMSAPNGPSAASRATSRCTTATHLQEHGAAREPADPGSFPVSCYTPAVLLITGPSGNVGSELVDVLRGGPPASGWRLASRHPDRLRARLDGSAQVCGLDFFDRASWPAALAGVDSMFLLFPLPGNRAARHAVIPFLQAAEQAGCRHVVYVSVFGADRIRFIPHYKVEAALTASSMSWTLLRCSFFMQNLHRSSVR